MLSRGARWWIVVLVAGTLLNAVLFVSQLRGGGSAASPAAGMERSGLLLRAPTDAGSGSSGTSAPANTPPPTSADRLEEDEDGVEEDAGGASSQPLSSAASRRRARSSASTPSPAPPPAANTAADDEVATGDGDAEAGARHDVLRVDPGPAARPVVATPLPPRSLNEWAARDLDAFLATRSHRVRLDAAQATCFNASDYGLALAWRAARTEVCHSASVDSTPVHPSRHTLGAGSLSCSVVGPNQACVGRNIALDWTKLATRPNRPGFNFLPGAFQAVCTVPPSAPADSVAELSWKGYLGEWMPSFVTHKPSTPGVPSCSAAHGGRVLFYQRDAYANPFHLAGDWLSLYAIWAGWGVRDRNTTIIIKDMAPDGPLMDILRVFTDRPVVRLTSLVDRFKSAAATASEPGDSGSSKVSRDAASKKRARAAVASSSASSSSSSSSSASLDRLGPVLCASEVIFYGCGMCGFIWKAADWPSCGASELVRDFVFDVVRALGAAAVEPAPKELVVTIIDRRKESSHAADRLIQNMDALVEALRASVQRVPTRIQVVDFAKMSLVEQVLTARRTHVLVGMHGAGLTNLLWLPWQGAAVVELFPVKAPSYHWFRGLARLRGGLTYLRWTPPMPSPTAQPAAASVTGGTGTLVPPAEFVAIVHAAMAAAEGGVASLGVYNAVLG